MLLSVFGIANIYLLSQMLLEFALFFKGAAYRQSGRLLHGRAQPGRLVVLLSNFEGTLRSIGTAGVLSARHQHFAYICVQVVCVSFVYVAQT
jgi:hypothetical protein